MKQVAAWLRDHYPTPYPVSVRWAPRLAHDPEDLCDLRRNEIDQGLFGLCTRKGKWFSISLSKRRCLTVHDAVDTLLHEWAHAVTWRHQNIEDKRPTGHDDEFFLTYGRIYRNYHEWGGFEESSKYPSGEVRKRKR